jgi:hypothetical protein
MSESDLAQQNESDQAQIDQLQIDQALSGAIHRQMHAVIQRAAKTAQLLQPAGNTISGMRESQLRNVVNVALSAQHVVEVAAFILYQMGRSTNSRQWQYNNFGTMVVDDLTAAGADGVAAHARLARDQAVQALSAAGITLADEIQQTLLDRAHIALARQYLGYLNRLFYYADRTQSWKQLASLVEANDD